MKSGIVTTINQLKDKILIYSIWIFLSLSAFILIGSLFANFLGEIEFFFSFGYVLVYIGIIGLYFIIPFILIRLIWLYKKRINNDKQIK